MSEMLLASFDSSPLPSPLAARELHTRFLYPFCLNRGNAAASSHALTSYKVTVGGESVPLWVCGERVDNYRQELHDAAVDYLFFHGDEVPFDVERKSLGRGCAYLTLNKDISNRWFQSLEVLLKQNAAPVRLAGPIVVELWISDHGVGVISLKIQHQEDAFLDPAHLANFNYRISNWNVYQSRIRFQRHRNPNPNAPTVVTEPDDDSSLPLFERLAAGKPFDVSELLLGDPYFVSADLTQPNALAAWVLGGNPKNGLQRAVAAYFERHYPGQLESPLPDAKRPWLRDTLNRILRSHELLFREATLQDIGLPDSLRSRFAAQPRGQARLRLHRDLLTFAAPGTLAPYHYPHLLSPLDDFGIERFQDRLSVYTVVRYGDSADFGLPEVRTAMGPELCTLTNIEEPLHAGAAADMLNVPNSVQNRRHWAGVGLLGAAHLVSDQPGEVRFNQERVSRMTDKYFMPYLLALMQRLVLQRLQNDASEAALSPDHQTQERIVTLRKELFEFEVNGHFTLVSSREAIHRWYKLCQTGLEVPGIMEAIRQAFAEIDTNAAAVAQMASGKVSARALTSVEAMQRKLEFFEVLIGLVYGGEFGHIIGEALLPSESAGEHVSVLVHLAPTLIGAAAGAILALLFLRPWQRHDAEHKPESH